MNIYQKVATIMNNSCNEIVTICLSFQVLVVVNTKITAFQDAITWCHIPGDTLQD